MHVDSAVDHRAHGIEESGAAVGLVLAREDGCRAFEYRLDRKGLDDPEMVPANSNFSGDVGLTFSEGSPRLQSRE